MQVSIEQKGEHIIMICSPLNFNLYNALKRIPLFLTKQSAKEIAKKL